MKRVYNSFYSKGFNIIGISRDKKENDWRKAMLVDNTPWEHGLDNVDDAGKKFFNLLAIPGYILVDSNGVIINTDYYSRSKDSIHVLNKSSLSKDLYNKIEILTK
jgi:hypothetical protein